MANGLDAFINWKIFVGKLKRVLEESNIRVLMEETNHRVLRAVGLTQNTILRMNNYLQRRYETDLNLMEDILNVRLCNRRSDCYKYEST